VKSLLLLLCFQLTIVARAQLSFSDRNVELGDIPAAKSVSGTIVITNAGEKKIFLMRADADPGVTVFTSKKVLNAGDTALLSIGFSPEKAGAFSKRIKLVTSDQPQPTVLTVNGTLQKLTANDAMACYYFGSRPQRSKATTDPLLIPNPQQERRPEDTVFTHKRERRVTVAATPAVPVPVKPEGALPRNVYKPNNLLFLVDVSGSMKDSTRLGYMKLTLHRLIDAIRDVDSISFITYADTVKVLCEAVSGADKPRLHALVDALKARGVTHGRKAMIMGQKLLQDHYITLGNNQMLIATDGLFYFDKKDEEAWFARQGNEPVIVSTIAFGDDAKALHSLKSIARKGNGAFIRIRERSDADDALLGEIKKRSAY
jgi:Mg-chelatase subunit ChlD